MKIARTTYQINNPTIENLRNHGIRYSTTLSTNEESVYVYRFPVYKYKRKTTLECEISVEVNSNIVIVNVYNSNHSVYAPFYNDEYGNFEPLLEIINKNIMIEFKKLGVVKWSGAY